MLLREPRCGDNLSLSDLQQLDLGWHLTKWLPQVRECYITVESGAISGHKVEWCDLRDYRSISLSAIEFPDKIPRSILDASERPE